MAEDYRAAQSLAKALLSSQTESDFQRDSYFAPGMRDWRRGYMERFGQEPEVGPGGDYKYMLAYALGARPEAYQYDAGLPHWPSSMPVAPYANSIPLKAENHPTMWMERFMQKYGVDPNEAPPGILGSALGDPEVKVPGGLLAELLKKP